MKIIAGIGMFAGIIMAGMDSQNFSEMLTVCTAGLFLFLGSAWILTKP